MQEGARGAAAGPRSSKATAKPASAPEGPSTKAERCARRRGRPGRARPGTRRRRAGVKPRKPRTTGRAGRWRRVAIASRRRASSNGCRRYPERRRGRAARRRGRPRARRGGRPALELEAVPALADREARRLEPLDVRGGRAGLAEVGLELEAPRHRPVAVPDVAVHRGPDPATASLGQPRDRLVEDVAGGPGVRGLEGADRADRLAVSVAQPGRDPRLRARERPAVRPGDEAVRVSVTIAPLPGRRRP